MKKKQNNKDIFTFDELTHTYLLNYRPLPSVTQVLDKEGFYNLENIPAPILQRAQNYGTALHKACELYDKKTLDMSALSQPLVKPLGNWIKFIDDYKVKFIEIEIPHYSPMYKFGFTIDRVALIFGKLTIIDIKSTTEVSPVTAIQLGGYELGFEDISKLKVKQRWIVKLSDKKYEVIEFKNPTDKIVFHSALTVMKWKKENNINGH